jgi:hypothetical protein
MVSVAHHHRAHVPARATGAKPKNPPRRAQSYACATHARDNLRSMLCEAQCVFDDDPDRPLTVGTPPPRVDPRCSASELHVLCSGNSQVFVVSDQGGEGVGTPKLGYYNP